MLSAEHGFERGIKMIVETAILAIILGYLIPAFVEAGLFPKYMWTMLIHVALFSSVIWIKDSRSWSVGYLFGVVFGILLGLILFAESPLITSFDIILYVVVGLGAVLLKFKTNGHHS